MGIIKSTKDDVDTLIKTYKGIMSWLNTKNERASGYSYKKLLDIEGYNEPYICLLNDWNDDLVEYSKSNLEISETLSEKYKFPSTPPDLDIPGEITNGNACRLCEFNVTTKDKLKFTFQETDYHDYLKSSSKLDFPYPPNTKLTYREKFGDEVTYHDGDVRPFDHLTNISGVGVFIKTSDNYVIVSRIPDENTTYPGRYTYSASGLMRWGNKANPFIEVAFKSETKLGIKLTDDSLKLISFGVDARQLYFQFTFLYETDLVFEDMMKLINSSPEKKNVHGIKISPEFLVNSLIEHCWEPAASAVLYNICAKYSSKQQVEEEIDKYRSQWTKSAMKDEWDYRASKKSLLSVMSVRYDQDELKPTSSKYVASVVNFIGSEIDDKDIVEIGSGIGRLTKEFLNRARSITCIDISKIMIDRSIKELGKRSNVRYIQMFGQDYSPQVIHDIAICSLVLIHNTTDIEYENLIENLCFIANKVYIFEDISDRDMGCSHSTKLRDKAYIVEQFGRFGYMENSNKTKYFNLDKDKLVFIEFNREKP